ncbi:hypothetical protein PVK06_035224 [Gossypium arboreum]|uniref:Uncharacterized protein n=1 Tax=Gossypium arboreum TaxID=29729 RepID=A0ABR0NGA5_GOSAR|nr:hypothetical protein PVK06_035224 [Gossypium arboreum]
MQLEGASLTFTARVESTNFGTTTDEGGTVAEQPKKTTSLNLKKEEEEKDETATATTTTTKSKDPVPPTPPAYTTAQDCDIDYLIDKLTEIDNEGDEMNPMKRKLRYKVNGYKSTHRAK